MEKKTLKVEYNEVSNNITYHEFTGKSPGPYFILTGGMHGDEINGVMIVSKFLEWMLQNDIESSMNGKLIIIPVLNPTGFAHMQRYVYEDNKDLNRCFEVKEVTSYAEYYAQVLVTNFFSQCDFGIDVHDSGGRAVLTPHPRFHSCTDKQCDIVVRKMAELFDTKVLFERSGHDHMLAVAMERIHKKPFLTLEVGGNQTLYTDWYADTLTGIRNVMRYFGLLTSGLIITEDRQKIYDERVFIKTEFAGSINFCVDFNSQIHVGEVIGSLFDPLTQKHSSIISDHCGVLLSKWEVNQIPQGVTMYSVLVNSTCKCRLL